MHCENKVKLLNDFCGTFFPPGRSLGGGGADGGPPGSDIPGGIFFSAKPGGDCCIGESGGGGIVGAACVPTEDIFGKPSDVGIGGGGVVGITMSFTDALRSLS